MTPSFRDGDLVVALKRWPFIALRRGQVVVFVHPELGMADGIRKARWRKDRLIVKRVTGMPGDVIPFARATVVSAPSATSKVPDGHCFLVGDSWGIDSREIGSIPISNVVGIVIARLVRG